MCAAIPEILVYCPDPSQARRYREMILARHPGAPVHVASTAVEAEPFAARAEIFFGWMVPPEVLRAATRLKWFQKTGAGVEDVVFDDVLPASVRLTRCDGAILAPRMVEYVLGAVYGFAQKFHLAWAQKARRDWKSYMVDRAEGRTLGIAGLGDIGREIARRAALNGLHVVGWRRTRQEEPNVAKVYVGREQLKDFVAACDIVVLVLPNTQATRGLFDADVFSAFRPGSFLVNVGRGTVVDETALVAALREGRLAGAALDVFAIEPLPADHPLWDAPNVLITPHVSGPIVPDEVAPFFLENLDLYLKGQPLLRMIDRASGY